MKCQEIQKQLTAYADNELDSASGESVRSHLEKCAACNVQFEEVKKIRALYRSLPELAPEPGYRERTLAAIAEAGSRQPAPGVWGRLRAWLGPERKVLRWAPAAAALLVVLLLTAAIILERSSPNARSLAAKGAMVYTYDEYVNKGKPGGAEPKFGSHSFTSID